MRLHSYLQSAESVLLQYDGAVPFAAWMKNYFKQNKKFGSRDRKRVGDLCFCYFRLGKIAEATTVEEALLLGQLFCHNDSDFIAELKPEWINHQALPAEEKLQWLTLDASQIFSFTKELSPQIESNAFAISHLTQPDLFLRIRPNEKDSVVKKLQSANIPFHLEGDSLQLANNSKIDELIELDKEAVVQDKSSQHVLNALHRQTPPFDKLRTKHQTFSAWDCCAASGGKSILLLDLFPNAQLTVSDIRESILHNLRNRFKRAGIQHYQSFVADVSSDSFRSSKKYDMILCDAPCSGSGTWGRTPEQLKFFQQERIDHYAALQKRIAVTASKSLKEGGSFVYITCSVFKKENEDVVEFILQNTSLQLQNEEYIEGYSEKADTLFSATFCL